MRRTALIVFIVAALVRFGGVMLTTLTDINPDDGGDTDGFAAFAEAYATGDQSVRMFIETLGTTSPTWGFFLSPFWLLPGPSQIYARLGVALVGAYAVYNVYVIVEHYFSEQAGLFAVTPLIFFPSFVALHSVILRDAAVLCGFVFAIRIVAVPSRFSIRGRYLLATGAILFASIFRLENMPIYAVMFLVGYLTWRLPRQYHLPALATTGIAGLGAYPVLERVFQWLDILRGRALVDFLIFMRNARISEGGRTQYLADVPVETLTDIFLYASIGIMYFLFVPFPWMAEIPIDYATVGESLITLLFALFAIKGVAALAKQNLPLAVALVVGFSLFVFFYGIISTNVGTSVRQRQTFSWMLFAFGGIGLARYIRIKIHWKLNYGSGSDESTVS